ncbi:MAG: acyltransferase [Verrucomicrobiota bacterium]
MTLKPSSPTNISSGRLDSLDAVRGLAALAVCWFHMTHGGKILPAGWIADASSLGHLGVAVFFVLSGFVIPWSLRNKPVGMGDCGRFLGKRMLRLQPPFAAACILAILLNWGSMQIPGYQGTLPNTYLQTAFSSFAFDQLYVTTLLGREWIIVVAWTLAIEVQFYMIAGFLAPKLPPVRNSWLLFWTLILACTVGRLIPIESLVFRFLPLFCLGWASAWLRMVPRQWMGWVVALISTGTTCWIHGWPTAGAAGITFSAIVAVRGIPPRILVGLGTISYSLYLIHVPLGGRIVNLGSRWVPEGPGRFLLSMVAMIGSIAAAWLFWRWVERPFHELSKRCFVGHCRNDAGKAASFDTVEEVAVGCPVVSDKV